MCTMCGYCVRSLSLSLVENVPLLTLRFIARLLLFYIRISMRRYYTKQISLKAVHGLSKLNSSLPRTYFPLALHLLKEPFRLL